MSYEIGGQAATARVMAMFADDVRPARPAPNSGLKYSSITQLDAAGKKGGAPVEWLVVDDTPGMGAWTPSTPTKPAKTTSSPAAATIELAPAAAPAPMAPVEVVTASVPAKTSTSAPPVVWGTPSETAVADSKAMAKAKAKAKAKVEAKASSAWSAPAAASSSMPWGWIALGVGALAVAVKMKKRRGKSVAVAGSPT